MSVGVCTLQWHAFYVKQGTILCRQRIQWHVFYVRQVVVGAVVVVDAVDVHVVVVFVVVVVL